MDVTDSEQLPLFGAPPGRCWDVVLTITAPHADQHGHVRITAMSENRKEPMHLRVTSLAADQMAIAVGYFIPIALAGHHVDARRMRAMMWRVHRQLGIAGWEVAIRGCGKG